MSNYYFFFCTASCQIRFNSPFCVIIRSFRLSKNRWSLWCSAVHLNNLNITAVTLPSNMHTGTWTAAAVWYLPCMQILSSSVQYLLEIKIISAICYANLVMFSGWNWICSCHETVKHGAWNRRMWSFYRFIVKFLSVSLLCHSDNILHFYFNGEQKHVIAHISNLLLCLVFL